MDEKLAQWIEWQTAERDRLVEQAFRAIKQAEVELIDLRTQLDKASKGEAFYRINRVDGVDAQAIFNAQHAIEQVAQLRMVAGLDK